MSEPRKTISLAKGLTFVFAYGAILGAVALAGVCFGTRVVCGAWLAATKAHPAKVYDCPWWVAAGSFGVGIAVLLVFLWGLRRTGLREKLARLLIR
jgi:hypothetical protein